MICIKGKDFYFDNIHWITQGDYRFRGRIDGKYIAFHRYIWEKYNNQSAKGFDIHHRDFNPLNNNKDNLLKLTRSEHMKIHFVERKVWTKITKEGILAANKKRSCKSKEIICLNDNKVFSSTKKAGEYYGICSSYIYAVTSNRCLKAKGLKFKYHNGGTKN